MAESLILGGESTEQSSDSVLDSYCEPCYDLDSVMKPVAGYCKDCGESLCLECFTVHLRPKSFRNHRLLDIYSMSSIKKHPLTPTHHQGSSYKCPRHHDEYIRSFCKTHSEMCCKFCLTIDHRTCDTEEIKTMSQQVNNSNELTGLINKLDTLKKDFTKILGKNEKGESVLENNYSAAMIEMMKLKDEFNKLMNETEKQAEEVKDNVMKKIESTYTACSVVIERISKMTSEIDTLQRQNDDDRLFIFMKKAEDELKSLETSLDTLGKDSVIRDYKFEPDGTFNTMICNITVIGHLISVEPTADISSELSKFDLSNQAAKIPTIVKTIKVSDKNLLMHGAVVLPNKQMLITDAQNKKLKLIDTNNGDIISETKLHIFGEPNAITKINENEIAVTVNNPNKIKLFSVINKSLSHERDILVNAECHGIAYNDKDKTFIVTSVNPPSVAIINMLGTVQKIISKDSNGADLFSLPYCVAMRPDMSGVYVSDYDRWYKGGNVTVLNLNGDVEAVYKDDSLHSPAGLYVHKTGLVYVVDYISNTVHQIDHESGQFKLLLNINSGVAKPWSISYCETEDSVFNEIKETNNMKAINRYTCIDIRVYFSIAFYNLKL